MKILPVPVVFVWDKGNIGKNWQKHEVTVKEAEEVFFNKPIKIYPDVKHSIGEERWLVLGTTNLKRKLTVIYTVRKQKIRIISARDQSIKERRYYEK